MGAQASVTQIQSPTCYLCLRWFSEKVLSEEHPQNFAELCSTCDIEMLWLYQESQGQRMFILEANAVKILQV